MTIHILGIDISKATFDVALLSGGGLRVAEFSNDPSGYAKLERWLKRHKARPVHACLEATGRYGEDLALQLHERGHQVSVVNPLRIKKYAASKLQRNKTDREDAKVIADFCATQNPALWTPPPAELRELQALVRRLAGLIEDHTREINRLKSGRHSDCVQGSIEDHLAYLKRQQAELKTAIQDHVGRHPALRRQAKLLESIPGIGARTAARLLGEMPDVSQFNSASQLSAYAGLSPREDRSGTSLRKRGRLVKTGKRELRTALYMPALAALRFNPIVQALAARLAARGKHKMVIVGAAMRKLLHLAYGVLKTGLPFDPNYAQYS